ncbi:unnamed protein product [Paramecium pentaurelia]|uniref:Protein kinase domain-containing protein n=1 Tax=Paramecium pentaurelia TaxID=43138 RepID=A0A8S1Y2S6_9CILI|nr:unnamed protein product [Paramecium pentaurelia]
MLQVDTQERYKLTIAQFQRKMMVFNDKIIKFIGFQLQNNNQRAYDFFQVYFQEGGDQKLYSFQLKRYNNQQYEKILNENSQNFIVLQYVEDGLFLNQLERVSFLTFTEILQQLSQAIFQLHQNKVLARCISSNNIFIDRQVNKIYLFEFGFIPNANFQQVYKANYDIQLVINIMKDLYLRKQSENNQFEDLMRNIRNLEIQLQDLDEIQSYLQFYSLIQGGPSLNQLQNLYTSEWVQTMNQLIKNQDFLSPLPFDIQDPDQTDDDCQHPTQLKLQKLATKIFSNKYPTHYDQIGFMLRFQSVLNDQSIKFNLDEKLINKRRNKICENRIKFCQVNREKIDEKLLPHIKPEENEQLGDILKIYKSQTYKTYRELFKDKVLKVQETGKPDLTLDEAKICFLLIASLQQFDFQNVYQIYQSEEIVDKIEKIKGILEKYNPQIIK